jgi:two-component system response regulator HydG
MLEKNQRRILVVDDEPYTRSLIAGLFRKGGAQVQLASSGSEAERLFRQGDYNLVIMDQRLPDARGLDLLHRMLSERPRQQSILITGFADVRDAVKAVREGVFDYLTKPFENLEELEAVIEKALELDQAYREISSLRERLGQQRDEPQLIGNSPAIERLLALIVQVAPLDTTVLLEGESGTGKELVARLLHVHSGRRNGPFLGLNCGALPEPLLESTLFGYEKGAFTGAARATAGYIEEADGGSLFLDEVADMSPKLQSGMLRVLQERRFSRLGSTRLLSSDFRLICASNRPLADAVNEGAFREDLFYRLNVVALRLPPLRERREDILPLAAHFLDHFNTKFGKSVGPLTPEVIRLLEGHPWPGNVRELQHTLERVVALAADGLITPSDLQALEPTPNGRFPLQALGSYEEARGEFERDYLTRLLQATGGNVSEAARISGLARQNLYVRMNRWGLVSGS